MMLRTSLTLLAATAALSLTLLTAARPLQDEGKKGDGPDPKAILAEMGWLAGDWNGEIWGGDYHAYYTTPEGGRIVSHSRLVQDGKVAFYEFEVFEPEGDEVRMQPYPGGRVAGGFLLTEHDAKAKKATFENPKKDYPTRIVYHRVAKDKLEITLSDPHGKSDKVETFELER